MLLPMLWWWAAAGRAVSHCTKPAGSIVYVGSTINLAGGCSYEHTQWMCLTCAPQAPHSFGSSSLAPDSHTKLLNALTAVQAKPLLLTGVALCCLVWA